MPILILILAGSLLAAGRPAQPSPSLEQASAAFAEGRDQEAVEWLSRSSPQAAADLLFQWGRRRSEEKTRQLEAQGALRKNQRPRFFFEELIRRYPQSQWADDAALLLLEDGFCYQWGDYPDCPTFEILQYEKFLKEFPFSDQKPRALLEMARRYRVLAERYREPAPWSKPARAELCSAFAQSLWQELIENYPATAEAAEARTRLEQIPAAGRPAVPMPRTVFEFLSREGE